MLYRSLYLNPSPECFLYFYDTRPKNLATWLSLVSRPGISILDAFSQSFKHFKDRFFKVIVKETGCALFYNENGSTKFSFIWIDNPCRYKGMKKRELFAEDRQVVEVLEPFSDKLPTKGLVRLLLSVHPLVDLEGIIF